MTVTIDSLKSRFILDSRGNPTVEVDVTLSDGSLGRASVPSGASTGSKEALELRDHDKKQFKGKGVRKAVQNISDTIAPAVRGMDPFSQEQLDNTLLELDGTSLKAKLGANAILGVSLAVARAAAVSKKQPLYEYLGNAGSNTLPLPLMNVINGGAHADNKLDFQEFMIVPHGFSTFSDALRAGVETFHSLKSILKERRLQTNVGDEGGFAPSLASTGDTLRLLVEAIETAGYKPGDQISLAMDVAATEFFDKQKYAFKKSVGTSKTSDEMIGMYKNLTRLFPLVSIEDGLAENDWDAWVKMTSEIGKNTQIVGDDIFVTNPKLLQQGIETKAANAILIKLNQIGTLTETLNTIQMAKKAGFGTVISHRSGETEDPFIADFAVATNAGQIKTGSLCRTDRVGKYNQLLRIEESLKDSAHYAGGSPLNRN